MKPSTIVKTGAGIHVYWPLKGEGVNKKYRELLDRIANLHDLWFLEDAPPKNGARYRLLEKKDGKPLFEDFRTIGEVNSWLDGYILGLDHGQRGWK